MKDLMKKSVADLEKMVIEKREALKNFRFGLAGSKVTNLKEGRNTRKDIARLLTAINVKTRENK